MIYSVSSVGDMVDFLKTNPFVSMEDYMWKLSVPMIQLMSMDYSRVRYLDDDEAKISNGEKVNEDDIHNDFGVPIF